MATQAARLPWTALASLAMGACANLDAVPEFARGAEDLAQAAAAFYRVQLQSDRRLARLSVDLEHDGFEPAVRGAALIAETRRHEAAVLALRIYAEDLASLVELDADAGTRVPLAALAERLGELAEALDRASPDERALADALLAMTRLGLEARRRRAVQQLARAAHPHLEVVIRTLLYDVQRQRERLAVLRASARSTREAWFDALRADYAALDPAERVYRARTAGELVELELSDLAEEAELERLLSRFSAAAARCLDAHLAIQVEGAPEHLEVVRDFARLAREAVRSLEALRGAS
jgi:hypothetical protein